MIHNKCGGKLMLECSHLYVIQSPSIKVTTKGIYPGPVQIDNNKSKTPAKLICSQCQQQFSNKDEFENGILETCVTCRHDYPPSEIVVTDYVTSICIHCIQTAKSAKLDPSKIKDRMLSLYGEVLKKEDNPTLLTILMKK